MENNIDNEEDKNISSDNLISDTKGKDTDSSKDDRSSRPQYSKERRSSHYNREDGPSRDSAQEGGLAREGNRDYPRRDNREGSDSNLYRPRNYSNSDSDNDRGSSSSYSGGGFYGRHKDNDRSDSSRNEYGRDRDSRRTSKFRKYDKITHKNLDIDYKNPEVLKEFLTEKGKILSRLITGASAQNQHKLTREVKRSRYMGLLPRS